MVITFLFTLFFLYFMVQIIDLWENEPPNQFEPRALVRFIFWNTIFAALSIAGMVAANVHT